ncbi:Plastocyanin [Sphingomonas guangdongensis]|uniref:Plastocyanin n=2 Tax=Sphingomonas guangdongensis TaxID=1141890 RepID=A0A285QY14_9SPHN|nr:Plastocyanin [Sphingomonas guangdongensis]
MRLLPTLVAVAATVASAAIPAAAAPVTVQVIGVDGRPLAGAVVTLAMPGAPAPVPRGPYSVAQRDIQFNPQVLIVPVGATVSFPNFDKVRHHVYSFSKAKKFELKLFGRDESRSITFDKPGAVALGCNIHDGMNGVVYVTASPYTAQTDVNGRVRLNVAAGVGRVSVWHPSIRAAGNTLQQPATVTGTGLSTTLQLRR